MGDIGFLFMMFFCLISFVLMAFAVFSIGFVLGYKKESKNVLKRSFQAKEQKVNNEKEESAKREWKKFLEYDGSVPYEKN